MGKRKYFSNEDRRIARNAAALASKHRKAGKPTRPLLYNVVELEVVPPEVLVERDYRQAIVEMMANQDPTCSLPPLGYAASYYVKAWQMQRRFARGQ